MSMVLDAGSPRRWAASWAAVALSVVLMASGILTALADAGGALVHVIVRSTPASIVTAENLVRTSGGSIDLRLPIIHGFRATLPQARLLELFGHPAILSLTPDSRVEMLSDSELPSELPFDPDADGSLHQIAEAVGAAKLWSAGYTGRGVDVAVIDTGVASVPELAERIVYGPDLSFETNPENLRSHDAYGHGTSMAGIIAGRDPSLAPGSLPTKKAFVGIAPDSRIINVKVGASDGATDVSQVLAAIDWVVQHRRSGDLNIRVLNLSFGTDGLQDYRFDPLTYAVEMAWRAGIVVVVAGGNAGFGTEHLNNPAYSPYVIAVGAADMDGSGVSSSSKVAEFSSRGRGRTVDFVAPGVGVVSLRVAGSYIDEAHPAARLGDAYFRGSGTSQAAAVASGAIALLLEQRPKLTPDQVKYMLRATAEKMKKEGPEGRGVGFMRVDKAAELATPSPSTANQDWERGRGNGLLDAARGTLRLTEDGVELRGETDIFGVAFSASDWAPRSANASAWQGGRWMNRELTGDGWVTNAWNGRSWSGRSWSGNTWSGRSWSGRSWSGRSWSGRSWSSGNWNSSAWASSSWVGHSWSSFAWGE